MSLTFGFSLLLIGPIKIDCFFIGWYLHSRHNNSPAYIINSTFHQDTFCTFFLKNICCGILFAIIKKRVPGSIAQGPRKRNLGFAKTGFPASGCPAETVSIPLFGPDNKKISSQSRGLLLDSPII